jgi:Arabinogalactan endo-1,4-beta-galactosidase
MSGVLKHVWFLLLIVLFISCGKTETEQITISVSCPIQAADVSFLPQIEAANVTLYNQSGQAEDMLTTLKNAGCNTIRLRLWYAPADGHSGFAEVKTMVQRAKALGLKVWLTVHYSDTWADPSAQTLPVAWSACTLASLKDSVYAYTQRIMSQMQPDYIQIGNEINSGFLWPIGKYDNMSQFTVLLDKGIKAVRATNTATKIILHCAGTTNANWLFSQFTSLDYDVIGISYYPVFHGKDLDALKSSLKSLASTFGKSVVIAETAYPFTLEWNDWTNNIVGTADQLVTGYPATPAGQHDFLAKIKEISCSFTNGLGFCYWGGEFIAWKGSSATNGSNWENQAFYDFTNKALPVLNVYSGK